MDSVDACREDDFCGDDAHSLAFEVRGDAFYDGRVVEEALLADADIGGETGL